MYLVKRSLAAALIASVVMLAGCGGGGTTRLFSKPISESIYVTYPEWGPNRDVAVMPLVNVSKDKDAGQKVRDLLISEIYISGAFKDVVDEGEMLEVMKKLKLRDTDNLGKDSVKTLGDNLGVQAVIFGTVHEYNERSSKGAQFAVSLRMVDVETGSILWLGNASKEGGGSISEALGFSDGPTVIDVTRGVLEDLVDDLAGEVRHKKVKGKKAEAILKKAADQNAAAKVNVKPTPAQNQQAATPAPEVKGSAAGIVPVPVTIGNWPVSGN
ncbi:MAG TPA: GNA1162 family protein [Nitrospirota bacterium]